MNTIPILEVSNLYKKYRSTVAVNHLNLSIEEGMVYGLLGPNGSGKTTTLGMILGVINPTSGSYSWFGKGNDASLRKNIGAILEQPIFYPYMDAVQNLKITCMIKEVDPGCIPGILKIVGLYDRRNDPFKTYSLGMKQRLAIGAALVGDPKVMILDEPTNGLDPQGIAQIRELITDIAATGKTIILASHLLDEVQKVCSHFCILQRGKLIYQGIVKDDFSGGYTLKLSSSDNIKMVEILKDITNYSNVIDKGEFVELKSPEKINPGEINAGLFVRGITLTHLSVVEKTLEEQFLEIVKENTQS